MGFAGMARLGSTGAVLTNPSLLSEHPEEEIFTSTNLIQFYNLKSEDNESLDIPPTMIPLFAGKTKRTGNIASGYSISSQEIKFNYQDQGEFKSSGQSANSRISLSGALAYRWHQSSIGLALGLNRETQDARYNFYASSGGYDFLGSVSNSKEVLHTDLRLGATHRFLGGVVIGGSIGVPLLLMSSKERQVALSYSTFNSTFEETIEVTIPHVVRQTVAAIGAAFPLGRLTLYVDAIHDFYYTDGESQDQGNNSTLRMGIEIIQDKYRYLAGIAASEAERGDDFILTTTSGICVKHRYAESMYGVTWSGSPEKNAGSSYGFIFGTKFIY